MDRVGSRGFGQARVRLTRSQTAVCLKAASCSRPLVNQWKRCHGKGKRSWTADALCRLDSDYAPMDDSEQDLAPPEALFPHGGFGKDDAPFLPRFLLQENAFAHSPCEGVHHNQPAPSGKSPVQVRNARSYRFEKSPLIPSAGERSTARQSLPAPEPVNNFCWHPAESQQHNQPGRKSDEFDASVVSFQPLIFAHCPHQPRRPIIRLALSQGNRRHRVPHLAGPDRSQLMIVRW